MSIRLTSTSSQHLSRTANILNYNADYTYMGWWYLASDKNDYNNFFSIALSDGEVDAVQTNSDGTTLNVWSSTPATPNQNDDGSTLSISTWYHITAVRSAGVLTVYLNGVSDCTVTVTIGARAAPNGMWAGSWRGTGDFGNGRYFALKAWNSALTVPEIQAEMYTVVPRHLDGLYAWWPCLPGTAERALDYSGNNYGWTQTNTPTDEDHPPISWGAQSYLVFGTTAEPPAGAITASLTATSLIRAALGGSGSLAASTVATSILRGVIGGKGALTASVVATSVIQAALGGKGALTGSAVATTVVTATLTGDGRITASAIATSLLTGTLTNLGAGDISADLTATSALQGTLAGRAALTASAVATSLLRGVLGGQGALTSSPTATAALQGTLGGQGALTARNVATSALQATLTGRAGLTADAIATSALQGLLTGQGALTARIVGLSDCTGTLTGTGGAVQISARVVATSTLIGNLTDMNVVITVVALTLPARQASMTIEARQFELTLSDRGYAFTLPDFRH